jgi:3-hydroxy-3-methylglutaryl CoA synthase
VTGRGILGWGAYLPYPRLDRSTIAAVAGSGGGKGTRTVASFDEDTTTMGVEAARLVWRHHARTVPIEALWFSTVAPAYLDKTNATTLHAALRLDPAVGAYDAIGSVRSGVGALRAALAGSAAALVVTSDVRTGRPGSTDEANGGDAAAALLVGGPGDGDVLAELVGTASVTEEFLDRWRTPGEPRSHIWEERFGEQRYSELAGHAWKAALESAGIAPDAVDRVLVSGTHDRAVGAVARALAGTPERIGDDLRAIVGNTGSAHPALTLIASLEHAAPNQTVAQVILADGVEVLVWRTTDAIAGYRPERTVARQLERGSAVAYGKYLAWREWLPVEPPRRPEPNRPSASAASRSREWKFALVGSERDGGDIHLPPSLLDDRARPMADARGVIATYTVDRLAYSPSPPVVFAVVDFDEGGRVPVEMTDCAPDEAAIGMPVEMTFRKLFTADGVHNYFWKARPAR